MAKFFNRFANILFPIRNILVFSCFSAVLFIFYLFVFSTIELQALYLTPALLVFLWGLLLFIFCHSFQGKSCAGGTNESHANKKIGWFDRVKQKLTKIFLWLYSFAFIVLILISIHFSLKVLTV